MSRQSKTRRILDIYTKLCEGRIINKAEEAQNFGVMSGLSNRVRINASIWI